MVRTSRTPLILFLVVPALVMVAFVAIPSATRGPVPAVAPTSTTSTSSITTTIARSWPSPFVSVLDYLPRDAVTDGSVDYTVGLQTAIDSAVGRTLVLPDFPLLVSKRPGQTHCLLVTRPITITGVAGSVLREIEGAVQILRIDTADGVLLENFTLQGKGGQGQGLAHGLLQVWRGTGVTVRGVTAQDSDADGIVIANVTGARIVDCRAVRTSKSGVYMTQCKGGVVQGCIVEDGRGHRTLQGNLVGAGIQLSSNTGLVCSGNVVRGGVGIGILCDANDPSIPPAGCVITGNRVENVRNPENMDASCGIRLQNLALSTAETQTLVVGNSISNCGVYGIYVENHGRSSVVGNTIRSSERSGLVIGKVDGVFVSGNTILDSDVGRYGNCASIYLINNARNVEIRGNRLRNDVRVSNACACTIVQTPDDSLSIEPQVRNGSHAPTVGTANRGDIVWNSQPALGGSAGWVCTSAGSPGTWSKFGKIE